MLKTLPGSSGCNLNEQCTKCVTKLSKLIVTFSSVQFFVPSDEGTVLHNFMPYGNAKWEKINPSMELVDCNGLRSRSNYVSFEFEFEFSYKPPLKRNVNSE